MKERIQKILANEGIVSRRQAENLIREGRIKVNGQEAILGISISRRDLIEIDETVVEIATDKVDSEIPSSVKGILKEILS